MEEMVAKRDINRFPDQKQKPLYYTKEELEAYNNSDKIFVQEKTLEQKEKELEDVLKDLIDEKYIQIKTGELEVDDEADVTVDDCKYINYFEWLRCSKWKKINLRRYKAQVLRMKKINSNFRREKALQLNKKRKNSSVVRVVRKKRRTEAKRKKENE